MNKPIQALACASLVAAIAVMSGCASSKIQDGPVETVIVPSTAAAPGIGVDDLRGYHSSWGHEGRGGAAVRKPAYIHVLGTPDKLDARSGRLYPPSPASQPGMAAVGAYPGIPTSLVGKADCKPPTTAIIASAREYTDEYIQVRNKLCAGAERLTYEEWQILVNGTPKDVPVTLQPGQATHTSQEMNRERIW